MFGKAFKTTLKITAALIFTDDENSDNEQLDNLNDGMGNVIADGEHMTEQEAADVQSRGELYDTYY